MGTIIGDDYDPQLIQGSIVRDRLFGDGGKNKMMGFAGDDRLVGGGGRDTMIGGEGDDVLRGDGQGKAKFADIFVFGKNSGKDIITDFQIGKDVIEIFKGLNGIRKATDVLDHARQKGKDVVIDLGDGNKITLKGVDLDDLKTKPSDHFDVTKNLGGW